MHRRKMQKVEPCRCVCTRGDKGVRYKAFQSISTNDLIFSPQSRAKIDLYTPARARTPRGP